MIAGINNIQKLLSDVLKRFDISDTVEIRYSNIENVDVQCNNLVRYSKNPDILEIKKEIISNVKKSQLVKHIEINDQNFININLSDEYLYKFSQNLKKRISHNKINSVIIDYGGPNIGKDLHVGHIRTLNIGRALYNILELSGSKVISDIHFGDWGMPVAQIIAYIEFKKLDINEIDFQDLEVIYPKANQLSREMKISMMWQKG